MLNESYARLTSDKDTILASVRSENSRCDGMAASSWRDGLVDVGIVNVDDIDDDNGVARVGSYSRFHSECCSTEALQYVRHTQHQQQTRAVGTDFSFAFRIRYLVTLSLANVSTE